MAMYRYKSNVRNKAIQSKIRNEKLCDDKAKYKAEYEIVIDQKTFHYGTEELN